MHCTEMEPKPNLVRNILVRVFFFCVLILGFRFAYVVTIRGESCDIGDFCFFSLPENFNLITGVPQLRSSSSAIIVETAGRSSPAKTNRGDLQAVQYYSSVFQDLISDGYLSPDSKSLCIQTLNGEDVFALKEIGVSDSIGIFKKATKLKRFDANTFDFIFSGIDGLDKLTNQSEFASEISRTLKPEGFFVVHTSSRDTYSLNSFIALFNFCRFVRSRDIDSFDLSPIREIVMKKENDFLSNSINKCSVPGYKQDLFRKAEPLIEEEPLKPWIALKRNVKNIKYFPSMADISFKRRYIYVDVGARSYGSSIVSWFKKQYPKQNKTFEIYAIEADKAFHEEYRYKKGVKLLPYAAWVKNETLFFEVNEDPSKDKEEKANGRGMGRIKPVQDGAGVVGGDKIQGFDFSNWLKNTVSEKDFVVMKMDVEGTEFELIPRLIETGAICLIDEIFLECHYNRWQKCCPGERSPKYQKTYGQCLELFASLRERGILVHQWW